MEYLVSTYKAIINIFNGLANKIVEYSVAGGYQQKSHAHLLYQALNVGLPIMRFSNCSGEHSDHGINFTKYIIYMRD